MKKRLRKKTHRGEFTEWGRQLFITRSRKDGFDEFVDTFIEEAIVANGCCCGGGGEEDNLNVIVELGCRSNDPDARVKAITAWLNAQPDVQGWKIGEEFDLWYGDFEDIDDDIRR
ncbi:MAG: 50S ribosome-binding protein YggL [Desulfomonilaceae bacterium]